MEKQQNFFYQCEVLDNQDPAMLGRIRGRRITDDYNAIINSITDPPWNPETDPWSIRDPFVFQPLLPYYIYQTPKVEEMVLVMYSNPDFKFVNQYYIQSTFYSPTSSGFQYWAGGDKFMGTGIRFNLPPYIKKKDGSIDKKYFGVFPQPGDNALLGRGSADVIVKEDEVLIRAGKYAEERLRANSIPTVNNFRGFLQLSRFPSTIQKLPSSSYFESVPVILQVKYLIEYYISNPENEVDKFGGAIYLYQLKPNLTTNSKNLTVNSDIPENLKYLFYRERFTQLTKSEVITFINKFIQNCNQSDKSQTGEPLFSDQGEKFPIFYRPSPLNYQLLNDNSGSGVAAKHFGDIYKGIKLYPALEGGYGLIISKDNVGSPVDLKKRILEREKRIDNTGTYGALGSDKLFLLSHLSSIPGKKKINFDDTLYGISAEKFGREIIPNTSSMVRGEELLELLNLIVRFLVTHTHPFPGYAPVTISKDGTQVQNILTEMQNATNKVLNQHIRIN